MLPIKNACNETIMVANQLGNGRQPLNAKYSMQSGTCNVLQKIPSCALSGKLI